MMHESKGQHIVGILFGMPSLHFKIFFNVLFACFCPFLIKISVTVRPKCKLE